MWTIGYGHTVTAYKGKKISSETAEELFEEDLKFFIEDLHPYMRDLGMSQQQFDSVVSLVYNIGITSFRKSKAYKALKQGDYERFCYKAFDSERGFVKQGSTTLKGLQKRRADEERIFNEGIYKRTK